MEKHAYRSLLSKSALVFGVVAALGAFAAGNCNVSTTAFWLNVLQEKFGKLRECCHLMAAIKSNSLGLRLCSDSRWRWVNICFYCMRQVIKPRFPHSMTKCPKVNPTVLIRSKWNVHLLTLICTDCTQQPGFLSLPHYLGASISFTCICFYTVMLTELTRRCVLTGYEKVLYPLRVISTVLQIIVTICRILLWTFSFILQKSDDLQCV